MQNIKTHHQVRDTVLRPIPAVIAVVLKENRILLVRRANAPDAGRWGFPGGKIEIGETSQACAIRELKEETSVVAEALDVFTSVDSFDYNNDGCLQFHYVLVAVLCRWTRGDPVAADDALDAKWFSIDDLDGAGLALSLDVVGVARRGRAQANRLGLE